MLALTFLTSGDVYMLKKQITIKVGQFNGTVPSVSDTGVQWGAIQRVDSGTVLTATDHDGYFVGSDGVINIMTLHPSVIDLLKPQRNLSIAATKTSIKMGEVIELGVRGGSGDGQAIFGTSTPSFCHVTYDGNVFGKSAGACVITLTKEHDDNYFASSAPTKTIYIKP